MDKAMKSMVELYTLGILSDESRRVVELAYDTDAEVQAWFEELGEIPDHIDVEFDSEAGKRMVVEVLKRHPGSRDAILGDIIDGTIEPDFEEEFEDDLAEVSEERGQAIFEVMQRAAAGEHSTAIVVEIRKLLPNSRLVRSKHFQFEPTVAGLAKEKEIRAEENYGIKELNGIATAFIDAPVELLPHGLCVLILSEPDSGRLHFVVPKLRKDFEEKNWIFTSSLYDLLGYIPMSKCRSESIVEAFDRNIAWFRIDMIVNQIRKLQGEQGELAKNFLAKHEVK